MNLAARRFDTSAPQACQALPVTLSKVGEVYHALGDLALALPSYEESLRLRQARLQARRDGEPEAAAAAALDVALGCLKLADACEVRCDVP